MGHSTSPYVVVVAPNGRSYGIKGPDFEEWGFKRYNFAMDRAVKLAKDAEEKAPVSEISKAAKSPGNAGENNEAVELGGVVRDDNVNFLENDPNKSKPISVPSNTDTSEITRDENHQAFRQQNTHSIKSEPHHEKSLLAPIATDPPVSEQQRKAMWAAKEGHSTLGIPKSVGEKFVGAGHDDFPNFLRSKGMSEDDIMQAMDMIGDDTDMFKRKL